MSSFTYQSDSEADTAALGAALAALLPDGATVSLCGTLGSGKTRLVQATAEAAGIDRRQVQSPTFVLIQEYEGDRRIYHFDAYRIHSDQEFLNLGPEEYFEGDGLSLVEWGDRVADCLPEQRIEITLEVTGECSRQIEIRAIGARFEPVIEQLRAWAAPGC